MRTAGHSVAGLLVLLSLSSVARADGLLRLVTPAGYAFSTATQTLQGYVDAPSVRQVEVEVSPFLAGSGLGHRKYIWDVTLHTFQGPVVLFPGLNLVSVRSLGRALEAHYGFYLRSPGAPSAQGQWGAQSPIVFTQPRDLRGNNPSPLVEGVILDPAIRTVDILALHSGHFVAFRGEGIPADRLSVKRVPVKDGRFHAEVPLAPGNNILIARAGNDPVPPEKMASKNLIYERTSAVLRLEDPVYQDGVLRLRGTAAPGTHAISVVLSGSVLAMDPDTRRFAVKQLFQTSVTPGPDGRFNANVPLVFPNTGGVNDFPLIDARWRKEEVTKTWFDENLSVPH